MTWGFVVMGVATVASAAIKGDAAEDAEDAMHAGFNSGIREIDEAVAKGEEALMPVSDFAVPALENLAAFSDQKQGALPILQEFSGSGADALADRRALMGLEGDEAYMGAIDQIRSGPAYDAMVRESEEAILQNAAATGGVRGGNTQNFLARNRQNILGSLVRERMGDLQNLSNEGLQTSQFLANIAQGADTTTAGIGSNAALARADLFSGAAQSIADLRAAQGQAAAEGKTAQGGILGDAVSNLGGMVGGLF